MEIASVGAHAVLLRWTGEGDRFEVQHRPADGGDWDATGDVVMNEYKVLDLSPETAYEFRVRVAERGEEPGPYSDVVSCATTEHVPRRWHGFEVVEPDLKDVYFSTLKRQPQAA